MRFYHFLHFESKRLTQRGFVEDDYDYRHGRRFDHCLDRISAVFQGTDLLSFGEELSRELSRARASYYSSDRTICGAVDIGLRCPYEVLCENDLRAADPKCFSYGYH